MIGLVMLGIFGFLGFVLAVMVNAILVSEEIEEQQRRKREKEFYRRLP